MTSSGSRMLVQVLKDVGQAPRRPQRSQDNCKFPEVWLNLGRNGRVAYNTNSHLGLP